MVYSLFKQLVPQSLRAFLRDRDIAFQRLQSAYYELEKQHQELIHLHNNLERQQEEVQHLHHNLQLQHQELQNLYHSFIDTSHVEVLRDSSFQRSREQVKPYTLLDTCRLANLWNLCKLSNPDGNILEIGTFKGGAALHLSNSCPKRKLIVCDSFQGFESVDPILDSIFNMTMFKDNSKSAVESLLQSHQCNYEIIEGFFPKSCIGYQISPVSFVHLDIDTYKGTIESLEYLESEAIMIEKSIIVLDDVYRDAEGVDKAIREFTSTYKTWRAFPIFPSQGFLLHNSWFK